MRGLSFLFGTRIRVKVDCDRLTRDPLRVGYLNLLESVPGILVGLEDKGPADEREHFNVALAASSHDGRNIAAMVENGDGGEYEQWRTADGRGTDPAFRTSIVRWFPASVFTTCFAMG
jgi:hypothetical protein